MDKSSRINRLLVLLAPLGFAVVALLLLLEGLSAPPPTPAPPTPTSDPAQEIVVRVGERRITFADWAVAFYLDALMSRLSGQPVPAAGETLDRLVNDALILTAAEEGIAVGETDVKARISQLETAWGLTDEQVTAELAAMGLTREIWAEAIARLLTVERYLVEVVWAGVPAEGQADALATWLHTHRDRSGTKIDTHGLQPSLPEPMPVPTATAVAVSPLATPSPTSSLTPIPTATSTFVLVSPLPTPTASPLAMFRSESPLVGQPAPDFALSDANGQPVGLSDYRDRRKVVIVFFRTTG